MRADVFGVKPINRDIWIAVEHILSLLAAGDTAETILQKCPGLEAADIRACLLFAHCAVHDRVAVTHIHNYWYRVRKRAGLDDVCIVSDGVDAPPGGIAVCHVGGVVNAKRGKGRPWNRLA